ncbi:MAG: YidC/Oxa1 family membrane protein insertase [Anaerolineae bacterium]|nr:YidC/Oxa1 family membrane protein insertase [Anaerolineae bacterium]
MNDIGRFYYQSFLHIYLGLGQSAVLVIALFAVVMRLIFFSFDRQAMAVNRRRVEADRELLRRTQAYRFSNERVLQERGTLYQRYMVNLDILINWVFIQFCILSVGAAVFGYWGKLVPLRPDLNLLTLPWQGLTVPNPQVLWLNLNTPDPMGWPMPLIVFGISFLQRGVVLQGKPGQFTPWSMPFIMGIATFNLPSGASLLWCCLMITDIVLLTAEGLFNREVSLQVLPKGLLQQVPNPLTLINPRGRRRRQVKRAIAQGAKLPTVLFEVTLARMFHPPTLNHEDAKLYCELLLRDARALTRNKAAPDAISLRKRALHHLGQLNTGANTDVSAIYHELGRKQGQFGNSPSAIELAIQGYYCPQGTRASRANCTLLLIQHQALSADAQKVYQAFTRDYPASTPEYQNVIKALALACALDLKLPEAKLRERIPFNELALNVFGAGWAKPNLGLLHLAIKDSARAEPYLTQALSTAPTDANAAFGLALIQMRQQQWDASSSTLKRATPARGPVNPGIQALTRLREALMWLNAVPTATTPSNQIQFWRTGLQAQFNLRPLAQQELNFVMGRLEAIWGDWKAAGTLLEAAYNGDKLNTPIRYHYLNYLQINGEWQKARAVLPTVPAGAAELACLHLKQSPLAAQINPGPAETLPRAKKHLLQGRSEEITPLPSGFRFASPEQSHEWARIWISALISRGDVLNAHHSLTSDAGARLMKPERWLFEASLHWIEGNLIQAQKVAAEILTSTPQFDSALRLAGALAEARNDPKAAVQYWGSLQRVLPNPDPDLPLREALMHWRAGNLNQALALLNKLEKSHVGTALIPQAIVWQGRILLQEKAYAKARPVFERAQSLNIPEAEWYLWLCTALEQRDPKKGWGATKAVALLGALPGGIEGLNEIPLPEVASIAALVAVESAHPNEMLIGLTHLVQQVKTGEGIPPNQRENLTEALWRCALSFSTQKHTTALLKLVGEVESRMPSLKDTCEQLIDVINAGILARLLKDNKPKATALKQIESMLKAAPDLPVPRLAQLKVRVFNSEITPEEAHQALIAPENQRWVAQALDAAIRSEATEPTSGFSIPQGLVAFLTTHQGALQDFPGTLRLILPLLSADLSLCSEGGLCAALAKLHAEALELFQTDEGWGTAPVSTSLLAHYACHAAVEMTSTSDGRGSDVTSAQRYLALAVELNQEANS